MGSRPEYRIHTLKNMVGHWYKFTGKVNGVALRERDIKVLAVCSDGLRLTGTESGHGEFQLAFNDGCEFLCGGNNGEIQLITVDKVNRGSFYDEHIRWEFEKIDCDEPDGSHQPEDDCWEVGAFPAPQSKTRRQEIDEARAMLHGSRTQQ